MVRVFFSARPHGLYYIYGDCRRNEGIAYAHSLIKDNYPKYVMTTDYLLQKRNGILHINILDYMTEVLVDVLN